MTRCLVPGSYDPITMGHLEIIERGAAIFDDVIVAVLQNPSKRSLFPMEKRLEMIRKAVAHLPNVRTILFDGMTADLANKLDCQVILRGVRGQSDFLSEFPMAQLNRHLNGTAETLLMPSSPAMTHISSSAVREIGAFGGDISGMVPECIYEQVVAGFAH